MLSFLSAFKMEVKNFMANGYDVLSKWYIALFKVESTRGNKLGSKCQVHILKNYRRESIRENLLQTIGPLYQEKQAPNISFPMCNTNNDFTVRSCRVIFNIS